MKTVMIRITRSTTLNCLKVTLTFADSAEDFCFFLSLAANDVDDTIGFEAEDVLTDVLSLVTYWMTHERL